MKISRLDLTAFGPFAGHQLNFDIQNSSLHLIFGPNEAGKSSSLRALTAWLFGFPSSTEDKFIHPYNSLRVGGVLENANQTLEFIRRKGRQKTIRKVDDSTVIEPSELTEFLQGIDESTFRSQFALDYQEMSQGGQAIAEGSGELADILFAAATGIADLQQIKQRILDRADQLFTSKSTKKTIPNSLKEIKDLEKQIKENLLAPNYRAMKESEIEQATIEEKQIQAEFKQVTAQISRLERVQRALPDISKLNATKSSLIELAQVPDLRHDFVQDRRELDQKLDSNLQATKECKRKLNLLNDQICSFDIPRKILENDVAIRELHQGLKSYQESVRDLEKVKAEKAQHDYRVQELIRQFDHINDQDNLDQYRMNMAETGRIRKLVELFRSIQQQQNSVQVDCADHLAEIQATRKKLEKFQSPQTSTRLESSLKAAQRLGDIDQQIETSRSELKVNQALIDQSISSLAMWAGSAEQLAVLKCPSMESVDRFVQKFALLQSNLELRQSSIDELHQQICEDKNLLEIRESVNAVPSELDLKKVRMERDECLDELSKVDSGIDDQPDHHSTIEKLRLLMSQSDRTVDQMRSDADRVAEKTTLQSKIEMATRKLEREKKSLGELQNDRDDLERQWQGRWDLQGHEAQSPVEMKAWLDARQKIVDTIQLRDQLIIRIEELEKARKSCRSELTKAIEGVGTDSVPEGETLQALIEFGESLLNEQRLKRNEYEKLNSRLESAELRHERAQRAWSEANEELENWKSDWAIAVKRLAGNQNTLPDQAEVLLGQNAELVKELDEIARKDGRINGMIADIERFHDQLGNVCKKTGAGFDVANVSETVIELLSQLQLADQQNVRLEGLNHQLEDEQTRLASLEQEEQSITESLQQLRSEAGCEDRESLLLLEEAAQHKKDALTTLRTLELAVEAHASGEDTGEFIDFARKQNVDELPAQLAELKAKESVISGKLLEQSRKVGELEHELKKLDGSARLAELKANAEMTSARLVEETNRYVRLRLAQVSLERIMERYRKKHQNPILDLASQYFARLTCESFAGLQVDYDSDGEPILVGIRTEGTTVKVPGMSEGTCDQLYLAIRLASLTVFLESHSPIPLIIDDLLIKFDDQRAMATLELLHEVSQHTQVIFFTHHQHLVKMAKQTLGNRAQLLNL